MNLDNNHAHSPYKDYAQNYYKCDNSLRKNIRRVKFHGTDSMDIKIWYFIAQQPLDRFVLVNNIPLTSLYYIIHNDNVL